MHPMLDEVYPQSAIARSVIEELSKYLGNYGYWDRTPLRLIRRKQKQVRRALRGLREYTFWNSVAGTITTFVVVAAILEPDNILITSLLVGCFGGFSVFLARHTITIRRQSRQLHLIRNRLAVEADRRRAGDNFTTKQ